MRLIILIKCLKMLNRYYKNIFRIIKIIKCLKEPLVLLYLIIVLTLLVRLEIHKIIKTNYKVLVLIKLIVLDKPIIAIL